MSIAVIVTIIFSAGILFGLGFITGRLSPTPPQKTDLDLELGAEKESPIPGPVYEVAISKISGVHMYYPKVNGMYMHIMPEGNVILHKDHDYATISAKVAWSEEQAVAILTKYKNGGYKENIKRINL
jgi:hypothetical protein